MVPNTFGPLPLLISYIGWKEKSVLPPPLPLPTQPKDGSISNERGGKKKKKQIWPKGQKDPDHRSPLSFPILGGGAHAKMFDFSETHSLLIGATSATFLEKGFSPAIKGTVRFFTTATTVSSSQYISSFLGCPFLLCCRGRERKEERGDWIFSFHPDRYVGLGGFGGLLA